MANRKVGVFWEKNKNGKTYWTGVVNNGVGGDVQVILFHNDKKSQTKDPDLNLFLSEPKDEL